MIPFILLKKKKKQRQVNVFRMLYYLEENEDIIGSLHIHIFVNIHKKLVTEDLEYMNERKTYLSLCILMYYFNFFVVYIESVS